ncbi:MAG: hypothetical protein WAS21_28905 [Geminicoccaceae bacterium]
MARTAGVAGLPCRTEGHVEQMEVVVQASAAEVQFPQGLGNRAVA